MSQNYTIQYSFSYVISYKYYRYYYQIIPRPLTNYVIYAMIFTWNLATGCELAKV